MASFLYVVISFGFIITGYKKLPNQKEPFFFVVIRFSCASASVNVLLYSVWPWRCKNLN